MDANHEDGDSMLLRKVGNHLQAHHGVTSQKTNIAILGSLSSVLTQTLKAFEAPNLERLERYFLSHYLESCQLSEQLELTAFPWLELVN